eukprot:753915-Hanusia_phi.AAC.7
MVLTVEPGCYFIRSELEKAMNDPIKSCHIVAGQLEKYMEFGGVRLEDNIVVTENGVDNLTKVPRGITELENVIGHAYR